MITSYDQFTHPYNFVPVDFYIRVFLCFVLGNKYIVPKINVKSIGFEKEPFIDDDGHKIYFYSKDWEIVSE